MDIELLKEIPANHLTLSVKQHIVGNDDCALPLNLEKRLNVLEAGGGERCVERE